MKPDDPSFSVPRDGAPSSRDASASHFGIGDCVAVLLPLPLAGAYDYRVPEGMELELGDVVTVPLGRRQERGVVWGPGQGTLDPAKIRDVLSRPREAPRLPEATRRFVDWVSAYTLSPPGAVLKMVIPLPEALDPPSPRFVYRRAKGFDAEAQGLRLTSARKRVLDALEGHPPTSATDLARAAGVGTAVVTGLAEAGALEKVADDPDTSLPGPNPDFPGPILSEDQQRAATALCDALGKGFSVTLLEGVTGSGKTEVYFEAVAEALRSGKQVLILVPEIALTTQSLSRFERRFGAPPLAWHSDIAQGARRRAWRAVAEGSARVVVGARSALFLPYRNLGLIVVDEEHESAFKQEEGVTYHGRDMAVVRGQIGDVPVILASATPSLETVLNVEGGRYRRVPLRNRHAGAVLPEVRLVDLRHSPPEKGPWGPSWLSPPLIDAMSQTLASGEQVMLFLNRRGYAPLTLCRACGHRLQCPNCTAWLVEHRRHGKLQCHHCGTIVPIPRHCPSCGAEDSMVACGPGVERVAEETKARFPEARTALVASDTINGPLAAESLIQRVLDRDIDILIGTQILAKGLHFPLLTLVGVIDADLGLAGGDLRAGERTFQLLSQVAGRAGRGARPGTVLLQTYQPEHPVLQAMATGETDRFLEAEAQGRRLLHMPPFGRLVALVISGADPNAVEMAARALAKTAPHGDGLEVLGPAPAPLSLLRGRTRWRLLLKAPRGRKVQPTVRAWLGGTPLPSSVRVQIDVDPYSFL